MASGDDGGMMRATPPGPAYPPQQQQQENVQKIHKVIFHFIYLAYAFHLDKSIRNFTHALLFKKNLVTGYESDGREGNAR